MNKNQNFQNSEQKDNGFNYVRVDLMNNLNKDGMHDNIYTKINNIANNMVNNNLYEIKGRHWFMLWEEWIENWIKTRENKIS